MDERECLMPLIEAATLVPARADRVHRIARSLIDGMRGRQDALGIESLTRAFPLSSPAGLALLSLAEALLRIPDLPTASLLLRDRLGSIDWRAQRHGGWLSQALHLASRCVRARGPLASLATPVVLQATRASIALLAAQFVFAQDIHTALRRAGGRSNGRFRFSFDMLGEAAMTDEDAQRYLKAYDGAIDAIAAAGASGAAAGAGYGISVKLSAIHPRFHYTQRARVMRELLPRLRQLAHRACREGIALTIDAEESERLELTLDLIEALMRDPGFGSWGGLGVAVQAYQKRAPAVIDHLLQLARARPARLQLRLVKGAYWDAEIKLAQVEGLADYPVYTRKVHTDVAYAACARRLLQALGCVYPQFATHNAQTVAQILELADGAPAGTFEFQRLHGMGAGLYTALLDDPALARPVRVYAPVGTRPTLLAYLMRRLLENGAAASFVQRATDPALTVEDLIADPVPRVLAGGGRPHPQIALPRNIFLPLRLNAAGVDLSDPSQLEPLEDALARARLQPLRVEPLIAADPPRTSTAVTRLIRNPSDRSDLVGEVYDACDADIVVAVQAARGACRAWGDRNAEARGQILERVAELFEQHASMLSALAVRESGKSLANAVGEVREAVDYLRYYAARLRIDVAAARISSAAAWQPLGVVVCISPWNFPLAIFTGQVSAALAAGNVVLAKPAEQSTALACHAARLMHEAGVPPAVLQLLPGSGDVVGARLVADEGVDGVIFTGSAPVAREIARALARRGDVPLIAETGGQNAMIVDSSALPEQVVADVLRSAFDSAGQRCSALRLLCLQREIAGPLLTMLEGAMRELRVGDPAQIATDVGPLIDEEACERIRGHLRRMQARIRCQSPMDEAHPAGLFIPPTLIEIGAVSELTHEVFGPVLHVLRYDRDQLDALIRDINATGYGLTMGVASRVGETVDRVSTLADVGNLYINRNMIGAVVGLQPFGGRGLSGTGPKAGGPWYLHRLARPLAAAAQREPFEASTVLHGYVGERNELRLQPLGVLRATGRSPRALTEQLTTTAASGNRWIADDFALARAVCEQSSGELREMFRRCAAEAAPEGGYHAVLVDAQEAAEHAQWLRDLLRTEAAREGPIIPVLIAGPAGYALDRLSREQTLTSNTAAVGGDIRLLTLSDA
jgi:RHH-type proline utilization regulon transcriptional repressor/proline dehydrogenase/delta 1-pyrroline-5-carboxylate dehydrogenase